VYEEMKSGRGKEGYSVSQQKVWEESSLNRAGHMECIIREVKET